MAKYAQGYERKNSDTKNLIWLIAAIVAVIALGIGAVIIYNSVKKDDVTLASYESYQITNFDNTLTMAEEDYLIYVYDLDAPATSSAQVLKYMAALEKGKVTRKVYLVDYDQVYASSSDTTITANATTFGDAIKYKDYTAGTVIVVMDNKVVNTSSQIYTDSDSIIQGFKALLKNKPAFGLE